MSLFGRFTRSPSSSSGVSIGSDVLISAQLKGEVDSYRTLEGHAAAAHKSCKRYAEAITEHDRQRARYRDLFDLAYFKAGALADEQERFGDAVQCIGEKHTDLRENVLHAVHDPIKKYSKIFPAINESIKHHEKMAQAYKQKAQKCDKVRTNVSADQGKVEKAERELAIAEKNWEVANLTLPDELPRFNAARPEFFDPCLRAFIKSQASCYGDCRDRLEDLCFGSFEDEETYREQTNSLFHTIESLSITQDDASTA